jgi:hypothetical protein
MLLCTAGTMSGRFLFMSLPKSYKRNLHCTSLCKPTIKRRSDAYTKVTEDHLHMTFTDNQKQRSVCMLEKKNEALDYFLKGTSIDMEITH